MNLTDPILRHGRMQPSAAALVEGERTSTYGLLADLVLRTAGHLAALGVEAGGAPSALPACCGLPRVRAADAPAPFSADVAALLQCRPPGVPGAPHARRQLDPASLAVHRGRIRESRQPPQSDRRLHRALGG